MEKECVQLRLALNSNPQGVYIYIYIPAIPSPIISSVCIYIFYLDGGVSGVTMFMHEFAHIPPMKTTNTPPPKPIPSFILGKQGFITVDRITPRSR